MSETTPEIDFDALTVKTETSAPSVSFDEKVPNHKVNSKNRLEEMFSRKGGEKEAPKSTRAKAKKAVPPYRKGQFVEPLTQTYAMIGVSLMAIDPPVAKVILEQARPCAESLDELAKTNPSVRKALISLTSAGAWSAVAMAHAPIAIAIAVTHVPSVRALVPATLVPTDESENATDAN